jgi:hypothetical protein
MVKRLANEVITVGQLKAYLNSIPNNAAIVLSCDSEGNNYSPLLEMGLGGLVNMDETMSEILDDGDLDKGADYREALILYPSV